MTRISVVIPAYNEETNLEKLIRETVPAMKGESFEIITVDDNSTDSSSKILDGLKKKYRMLKVIHRKTDRGVGFALREGFSKAGGAIIVTMDGDLSHNPEDIPRLTRALEEKKADIILGSRYMEGGGIETGTTRKIISSMFNAIVRIFFRTKIKDLTTGFRVHRKEVLEKLNLISEQFEIHIEIPLKAVKKGFKVVEEPIMYRKRFSGRSKLDYLKMGPRYIITFFRILLVQS